MPLLKLREGLQARDVMNRIRDEVTASKSHAGAGPKHRRRMVRRAVAGWLDEQLVWGPGPAGRIAEALDGPAARLLVDLLIELAEEGMDALRPDGSEAAKPKRAARSKGGDDTGVS